MSEKRFVQVGDTSIKDTLTGEEWYAPCETSLLELLNEQQSTIDKLDQENADLLGARIKAQEEWEKCTDKLKKKILGQQDTIEQLKEENEKLRKELGDCEKFRYTVFKRLNEEHIKECSIK